MLAAALRAAVVADGAAASLTQTAATASHLYGAGGNGDDSLRDKLAPAASVRRCWAECFFAICLATRLRTFAEPAQHGTGAVARQRSSSNFKVIVFLWT